MTSSASLGCCLAARSLVSIVGGSNVCVCVCASVHLQDRCSKRLSNIPDLCWGGCAVVVVVGWLPYWLSRALVLFRA
jgi:hypothetical protein